MNSEITKGEEEILTPLDGRWANVNVKDKIRIRS